AIGKEFIQLLHEYRSKKVNPAHLELDELYNPQKLYNYLRNHHWKEGIPKDFIDEWYQMNISNYKLNEADQIDFEKIKRKLGLEITKSSKSLSEPYIPEKEESSEYEVPSPKSELYIFKHWIKIKLDHLEDLSQHLNRRSEFYPFFLKAITELKGLLDMNY
ncbi:MAG: hypothetical protein ACFFE5_15090, partial [Candidatus Thorarchaeota archaeon]